MIFMKASSRKLYKMDQVQDLLPHTSVIPRKEAVEMKSDGDKKMKMPKALN